MAVLLERINVLVWGIPTLVLILGVGLLLCIRTGFAQLRLFPKAVQSFFGDLKGQNSKNGISSFQALCTALAATVGTGNLVGVAGAICLGGPGSIFWMWVCGVIGMMTKFAEATLAVRYRVREGNTLLCGPMYMIRLGLGRRWQFLAPVYAFLGVFAAFGVGNATQINAVITGAEQMVACFGGSLTGHGKLILGLALAALVGCMLLGGAKRIANAAELLVPFVSCVYLLLCIGALAARVDAIPAALRSIVTGAFSPRAATGGLVGSFFQTLRIGVSRGIFTNEAGMGTASLAHGGADVAHPAQQGLMGIMEVFLDTIVICTLTALVILTSGVPIPYGIDAGARLTVEAFRTVCGGWVTVFLALAMCCFAFATVLGWGLYGARCAQYLFGAKSWKGFALAQSVMVVIGALLRTGTIWTMAEIMNGLMAIPNLITLVGLSGEVQRLTLEYITICGQPAAGGTYENFDQCKPLSALSHAEIPPLCAGSHAAGQEDLPSEHRPARYSHPPGLL